MSVLQQVAHHSREDFDLSRLSPCSRPLMHWQPLATSLHTGCLTYRSREEPPLFSQVACIKSEIMGPGLASQGSRTRLASCKCHCKKAVELHASLRLTSAVTPAQSAACTGLLCCHYPRADRAAKLDHRGPQCCLLFKGVQPYSALQPSSVFCLHGRVFRNQRP